MKTIHPAVAQHAMEENEKLRGLLRGLREITSEYAWDADLEARVDAALSQQAEPVCDWPTCECALDLDKCKVQSVEPAPAQDERDSFKRYRLAGEFCVSRGIDDDSEIRPKILDAFCSGYACADRPAQTEQQPVAWIVPEFGFLFPTREAASRYLKNIEDPREPRAVYAAPIAQTEQPVNVPEGCLIELGFDVLDRAFRFVESKSHTPTIKVIFPPCEPVDSSAWDLRDEVARRIGSVLATPDMAAKDRP